MTEPPAWFLWTPTAALGVVAAGLALGVLHPRSSLFGEVVSRRPAGLRPLSAVALTLEWDPARRGAGVLLDRLLGPAAPPVCVFISAGVARERAGDLEALLDAGHALGSRGRDPAGRGLTAGYAHWRHALDAADDALADATGRRPLFFRPAGGLTSPAMLREAAAGGQAAVTWARRLPPLLPVPPAARWLAAAGPGAVLDLGADPLRAAAALPPLVSALADRGLRSVPLAALIGLA